MVYQGPLFETLPDVLVKLQWKTGQVSSKEAMAAKRVVPQFNGMGISSLLELFRQSTNYGLGVMPAYGAHDLLAKAEPYGLIVVIEPLPESE